MMPSSSQASFTPPLGGSSAINSRHGWRRQLEFDQKRPGSHTAVATPWTKRLVVCVVCGVWSDTLKKKRVYVHNVAVCTGTTRTCTKHVRVVPVHTEEREEGGGRRQFLLTQNGPRRVITCPRGSTKKIMHVTNFQFEKRSRTTRCRVHLFASPEHTVQLQTHDTTTHTDTHTATHNNTAQNTPRHRSKERRRRDERDEERQR